MKNQPAVTPQCATIEASSIQTASNTIRKTSHKLMLRAGSKLSRLNVMRYRDTERDYCQMTIQSEQCMDLLNIDFLHSHLTLPRTLLNFNAFDFLDPPYGILTNETDLFPCTSEYIGSLQRE